MRVLIPLLRAVINSSHSSSQSTRDRNTREVAAPAAMNREYGIPWDKAAFEASVPVQWTSKTVFGNDRCQNLDTDTDLNYDRGPEGFSNTG